MLLNAIITIQNVCIRIHTFQIVRFTMTQEAQYTNLITNYYNEYTLFTYKYELDILMNVLVFAGGRFV